MFRKAQQIALMGELERLRTQVATLEAEIARGVRIDGVTGLLSERAFRGRLSEEIVRARRYQRRLSLAVVAIDDFASIETLHGFKASDTLLAAIGMRLSQLTRAHDLIGRTGSAEFSILLPETDAADAKDGLGRLLVEIEAVGEGTVSGVTASAGIATDVIEIADSSMPALPPDAIPALAVALAERDRYTGEHSRAVIDMSAGVARYLGLRASEIERIKSAALVHDIGKVAIPDEILRKPGPLTDEEWVLMREHPVIGERILSVLPGMSGVARIVRHEHERWDGKGYPDGLAGEEIPLGSRVIFAADTYHAMTSDRPYRAARSHAEAIQELTRCAGSQFDPAVTAALIGYMYGRRQAGAVAA